MRRIFLFIIVLIVGVVVVVNPKEQLKKIRDIKRKADLAQIQTALEKHYAENGSYPLSTTDLDEKPYRIRGFKADHVVIDWGEEWQPYMQVLPKDTNDRQYVYFASKDGQAYWLYASLEQGAKDLSSSLSSNNIFAFACGEVCNYAISSRNVSP